MDVALLQTQLCLARRHWARRAHQAHRSLQQKTLLDLWRQQFVAVGHRQRYRPRVTLHRPSLSSPPPFKFTVLPTSIVSSSSTSDDIESTGMPEEEEEEEERTEK